VALYFSAMTLRLRFHRRRELVTTGQPRLGDDVESGMISATL
jgi:hypothetical protein